MKMHVPCIAAAIACLSACNDKIAPWTAASVPEHRAVPAAIRPWAPATPPRAADHCNIDSVNDQPITPVMRLMAASPSNFTGWVATTDMKNPGRFSLVLQGPRDIAIDATTSVARNDVAKALGSSALTYAGFRVEVGAHIIPPGTYRLSVGHHGGQGDFLCATAVTLAVQ